LSLTDKINSQMYLPVVWLASKLPNVFY